VNVPYYCYIGHEATPSHGKKAKSESARAFSREHFLNRELQALEFNRRVLAQAEDKRVPLLERLQVPLHRLVEPRRVLRDPRLGLKEQIKLGAAASGPDGLTPLQVFRQVRRARRASSSASTGSSTRRSCRRSRRRASASCAARAGRRRSRNGSATTSSAR
jgi:polyphosphate kinase